MEPIELIEGAESNGETTTEPTNYIDDPCDIVLPQF